MPLGYLTFAGIHPQVYVSNLDFGPFSILSGRNVHPPKSNRCDDGIYRDTGYHPLRCRNTELKDNCCGVSSAWVSRLNNAYQMVDPQTKYTFDVVFNDSDAACLRYYLRRL